MEEQEFIVSQTKQIAVKAISQEEACKKVLNGEGKVATMNMSASVRPLPVHTSSQSTALLTPPTQGK